MKFTLMQKLWNDDCGGVITAEYAMVFGVVALGAAQGLAILRDSTNRELQDVSTQAHDTRIHYTPPLDNAPAQQQPVYSQTSNSMTPTRVQMTPHCPGNVCP